MRNISPEELKTILENHEHWLNQNCEGWENMRADLHGAYLNGADLHGAYLSGADLHGAYLSGADLHGADLHGADLSDANLRNADLSGAYLSDADLRDADLRNADLHGAYLNGAYLSGADLSDADLHGAYLRDAKNVPYIPMVCPEEGKFIGWKKAKVEEKNVIVKLEIPASAKRSSSTSRKCRCDKKESQASSWFEAWNSSCLSRCPRGERPLVELYLEPGVFSERCTENLPLRVC